jgi:hypothetical protein
MSVRSFLRSAVFAGVALATISCATDSPLGPTAEPAAAPVADSAVNPLLGQLLGGTLRLADTTLGATVGLVDHTLTTATNTLDDLVHLLTCSALPPARATQTIGPRGGTIRFGSNRLEIPRGALKSNVRITAEQVSGSVNSVRFSPEGLHFAQSATLTMGYDNCRDVHAPKQIVYTDESLHVLEILKSTDQQRGESVSAPLDHFSRYAIAW